MGANIKFWEFEQNLYFNNTVSHANFLWVFFLQHSFSQNWIKFQASLIFLKITKIIHFLDF